MDKDNLTQIWSQEDYRRAVADFRAQVVYLRGGRAPERATAAPVIDIRTRERIA